MLAVALFGSEATSEPAAGQGFAFGVVVGAWAPSETAEPLNVLTVALAFSSELGVEEFLPQFGDLNFLPFRLCDEGFSVSKEPSKRFARLQLVVFPLLFHFTTHFFVSTFCAWMTPTLPFTCRTQPPLRNQDGVDGVVFIGVVVELIDCTVIVGLVSSGIMWSVRWWASDPVENRQKFPLVASQLGRVEQGETPLCGT